jgi:cytochrome c oxidase subunit 3
MTNLKHPFHIVTPSPWPFLLSIGALGTTVGAVMYLHSYINGGYILFLNLLFVLLIMTLWWRDVIREATFQGKHTKIVQRGIKIGVILFILSEVMFFASFFWAFFHSSLSPTIEIGCIWPPYGIKTLNPWGIPLLNTYILLHSGITITCVHYAIISGNYNLMRDCFIMTIVLALMFTLLQVYEYVEAPFTIYDGIYGSTFYMSTGFHGLHVIIGTIFIFVCFIRGLKYHFS